MAYSDDFWFLSEDIGSFIALTDILIAEAKKLGLNTNTQKTETIWLMTINGRSIPVDGRTLKNVDNFVYLGSTLFEDGYVRREVRARTGKVSAAFSGSKRVRNSTDITRKTTLQLFNVIVMAV